MPCAGGRPGSGFREYGVDPDRNRAGAFHDDARPGFVLRRTGEGEKRALRDGAVRRDRVHGFGALDRRFV